MCSGNEHSFAVGYPLEQAPGPREIEESLTDPGKLLSLSFWRDEDSVQRWRELEQHRQAQLAGRERMLADYRLRVAAVLRDYGKDERAEAPPDSREMHG